MNAIEILCANIIAGKIFKDKPEIGEQILKECGYNVEKIKENQKRVAAFRASSDYEDYLNSIGLDAYDVRRDIQAETHSDDEESIEEYDEELELDY